MEAKILKKFAEEKDDIAGKYIGHCLVEGVSTDIGKIRGLKTQLTMEDHLGHMAVRLGIHRDSYHVPTGLYAIGNPDKESAILVTANYKLTLDELRRTLNGLNLWILVIDTKGINVWCAAGKGTFSTEEIIYQVQKNNLDKLVTHRKLILPQLSAPGVAAHLIHNYTGFKAVYGPIRSGDIKAYLDNGCRATEEMRKVTFNLKERLVVSPLELVMSMKYFPVILLLLMLINLFKGENGGVLPFFMGALAYLGAIVVATLIFPALLPILPFRMFFLKSFFLALVWSGVLFLFRDIFFINATYLELAGHSLLMASIIGFLATNFTGSTSFTSLSGVTKETIALIPIVMICSLGGLSLVIIDLFL